MGAFSFSHRPNDGGGGGGATSFHPLIGGCKKFYPVLRGVGGGTKSFRTAVFPFCSGALDGGSPMLPVDLKKWQSPVAIF